jgi:hypothetical protein
MRKTKPILPERPGMGAGRRAAMSRRRAVMQNEANSGRRVTWLVAVSWWKQGGGNAIMVGSRAVRCGLVIAAWEWWYGGTPRQGILMGYAGEGSL